MMPNVLDVCLAAEKLVDALNDGTGPAGQSFTRLIRTVETYLAGLCRHCGLDVEADGDHSCSCPHPDDSCPDHPLRPTDTGEAEAAGIRIPFGQWERIAAVVRAAVAPEGAEHDDTFWAATAALTADDIEAVQP